RSVDAGEGCAPQPVRHGSSATAASTAMPRSGRRIASTLVRASRLVDDRHTAPGAPFRPAVERLLPPKPAGGPLGITVFLSRAELRPVRSGAPSEAPYAVRHGRRKAGRRTAAAGSLGPPVDRLRARITPDCCRGPTHDPQGQTPT